MDRRNFDCKNCGNTIGQAEPTLLYIGGGVICNRQVIRCVKCNKSNIWRPVDHLMQQPKTGSYVRV